MTNLPLADLIADLEAFEAKRRAERTPEQEAKRDAEIVAAMLKIRYQDSIISGEIARRHHSLKDLVTGEFEVDMTDWS